MAKFFALGTYSEESYQAFIKNPKIGRLQLKRYQMRWGQSFQILNF